MSTSHPIFQRLAEDFPVQFGLPPIAPPTPLSAEQMAEGDECEVRR